MSLWSIATAAILSLLLSLNALMLAIPYIGRLSRVGHKPAITRQAGLSMLLLLSLVSLFFVQVGNFSDNGLRGMFQPTYMSLIWGSAFGTFIKVQCAIVLLWFAWCWAKNITMKRAIYGVLLLFVGASFLTFGHGSDAAWWQKGLFLSHILISMYWLGSLLPLAKTTRILPVTELRRLMAEFGLHMSYAVPVLLLSGAVLFRAVTGRWLPEPSVNSYDLVFILKLVSVAFLLGLAAAHKLWFVPNLTDNKSVLRLRSSIRIEAAVALTVILLAVTLSNLYAPN